MAFLASKSPCALSTSCLETESVFRQILVAIGGDFRELIVRLRRIQIRAGLIELLVDFGSLDFGEQAVPASHVRADIRRTISSGSRSCARRSANR